MGMCVGVCGCVCVCVRESEMCVCEKSEMCVCLRDLTSGRKYGWRV